MADGHRRVVRTCSAGDWRRSSPRRSVDGTVGDDVDPDAVLFLVRILHLGLLLHRGSGLPGPDDAAWQALVDRIVASFGAPTRPDLPPTRPSNPTPPPSHATRRTPMTATEPAPALPDQSEIDATIKIVHDHADRIFLWNYDRDRDQLVTLYNKAHGVAVEQRHRPRLGHRRRPRGAWSTRSTPARCSSPRAAAEVDGSPHRQLGRARSSPQLGIEMLQGASSASSCTASRAP